MRILRLVAGVVLLSACGAAMAQTPARQPPASLRCVGDRIVWVNTASGIYHFQGERDFGATKAGKFMCKRSADRAGDRPTRNGQ